MTYHRLHCIKEKNVTQATFYEMLREWGDHSKHQAEQIEYCKADPKPFPLSSVQCEIPSSDRLEYAERKKQDCNKQQ
jgi:hypothetical protein